MIGRMISGTPITIDKAIFGAKTNSRITPPIPVRPLRSATDTVVPTAPSISAVSEVSREATSDGRFSSNQRGASRNRLACTAMRMSATVRSPSHDTK